MARGLGKLEDRHMVRWATTQHVQSFRARPTQPSSDWETKIQTNYFSPSFDTGKLTTRCLHWEVWLVPQIRKRKVKCLIVVTRVVRYSFRISTRDTDTVTKCKIFFFSVEREEVFTPGCVRTWETFLIVPTVISNKRLRTKQHVSLFVELIL